MTNQERNKVTGLKGRARRFSFSTAALLVALVFSTIQYIQKDEVSWLTDSFRAAETFGKELIGPDNAYRLSGKLNEYGAKISHVLGDISAELELFGLDSQKIGESIEQTGQAISGSVIGVTDGDTIKVVDADLVVHEIRMKGIDAPERDQPGGDHSIRNLEAWISGKSVLVQSSGQDEYGRELGKVMLGRRDINLEQVRAGHAWWYRYYAEDQPPADQRAYAQAEDTARVEKKGLWADPKPINPYEWRKRAGR